MSLLQVSEVSHGGIHSKRGGILVWTGERDEEGAGGGEEWEAIHIYCPGGLKPTATAPGWPQEANGKKKACQVIVSKGERHERVRRSLTRGSIPLGHLAAAGALIDDSTKEAKGKAEGTWESRQKCLTVSQKQRQLRTLGSHVQIEVRGRAAKPFAPSQVEPCRAETPQPQEAHTPAAKDVLAAEVARHQMHSVQMSATHEIERNTLVPPLKEVIQVQSNIRDRRTSGRTLPGAGNVGDVWKQGCEGLRSRGRGPGGTGDHSLVLAACSQHVHQQEFIRPIRVECDSLCEVWQRPMSSSWVPT